MTPHDDVVMFVGGIKGARSVLTEKIASTESELKSALGRRDDSEKALVVVREVANKVQRELEVQISDLVTTALDIVFPGEYEFNMEFKVSRGKTEVELSLIDKDGGKILPMDGVGGGVVDVCSFALRLACINLSKAERVLIMDEPFRFVSKDRQEMVGVMLKKLCDELDVQVLMVTHEEGYADLADNTIHLPTGE